MSEFMRSLAASANGEPNYYNVDYSVTDKYNKKVTSPICMLMEAKVRTLRKKDAPFNHNDIGSLFPKRKLFKHIARDAKTSCAIISSAGSLMKSGLGHFIGKRNFLTFSCTFIYFFAAHSFNELRNLFNNYIKGTKNRFSGISLRLKIHTEQDKQENCKIKELCPVDL